jgi:hypothetical protein
MEPELHIGLKTTQAEFGTLAAPGCLLRQPLGDIGMTRIGLIGAAAAVILSSAAAVPASAQQVIYNPGYCAQFYPNANCQNKGPGNPYTGDYQRGAAYQNSYDRWDDQRWNHDSGFWPGEVAAGVAGAAIGTAGAIATAPFRGGAYANDGAYAYDNGSRGYDDSYAARNGFVCHPGTLFRGEDGRRHLCQ